MKDPYDIDRFAHHLWAAVREFRKAGHHAAPEAAERAQDPLGELCSRFLGALLADDPRWPAKGYWFDGLAIDSCRAIEPHGIELVGRAHFAREQEAFFKAPASFELTAPPDARLGYRVRFDDERFTSDDERIKDKLASPTQWRFDMAGKR